MALARLRCLPIRPDQPGPRAGSSAAPPPWSTSACPAITPDHRTCSTGSRSWSPRQTGPPSRPDPTRPRPSPFHSKKSANSGFRLSNRSLGSPRWRGRGRGSSDRKRLAASAVVKRTPISALVVAAPGIVPATETAGLRHSMGTELGMELLRAPRAEQGVAELRPVEAGSCQQGDPGGGRAETDISAQQYAERYGLVHLRETQSCVEECDG
jgi:hypothetical protein